MILVIKDGEVLYSQVTTSKVEAIKLSDTLFGIVPKAVNEPQAIKYGEVAYVVAFSAVIPTYLHIREEFHEAQILVLDGFESYGEKVRSFYGSLTKDELFQEILKYRIQEVANGDACTIL